MSKAMSLAEALPLEQKRVRGLVKIYRDPILNGTGGLAAALMEKCLELAEKASAEQDTVAMLTAYNELKSYEV